MTTTSTIRERNRQNALRSTGPKTDAGKAVSRRNSLKHGLCANPAIGVVENSEAFVQMHARLVDRYSPRDDIEAGLVYRAATCLWRLQRSVEAETAATSLAVEQIVPAAVAKAQHWIDQINSAWKPEHVSVDAEIAESDPSHYWQWKDQWWITRRLGLASLDERREQEMLSDAAALHAMWTMLTSHSRRIRMGTSGLRSDDAEQILWLLGRPASDFPVDLCDLDYPWKYPTASYDEAVIERAVLNYEDDEAIEAADSLVASRLNALEQMRAACEDPISASTTAKQKTAARLPDAKTMDGIIRYETHAERGLRRALETLAQLRGATIRTYMTKLSQCLDDGSIIEFEGRQTTWGSGG